MIHSLVSTNSPEFAALPPLPDHARALTFPFRTPRPGQDLMLSDVEDAFANGLVLMCSAPTGIGKTAAALFPSLRQALLHGRRLFFVTAKTSQQELALDTLRELLKPGSGVTAVQISARDRSCPRDGRRCKEPRCRYRENFLERLERSQLLKELSTGGVLDRVTITARALQNRLCPFEVSLSLAERAHAVVSDFNYVFDPRSYLRRFFDPPSGESLLVVDEAHNLPARARGYYSPELDFAALETTVVALRAQPDPAFRACGDALGDLVAAFSQNFARLSEERSDLPPFAEIPDRALCEPLGQRIDAALASYRSHLASGGKPLATNVSRGQEPRAEPDALLELLVDASDFCRYGPSDPERFSALWTPRSVKLCCLDASIPLRKRINGFHAAVLMSATLTPLEFYAQGSGIDGPDTVRLDLPSPFPSHNRLIATVPEVDTRFKQRSESSGRIAEIIDQVTALRPGNYLAFFSSFAYRDEVVSKLPRDGPRVLLQLPGMPAEATLGLLRRNPGERRLLCAVHGGIFSEGVDYPGDLAIGVFVIGPGLPLVSAEQELAKSYHDARSGQGFEYSYLYPGLNRVVQAGGRAIRTPTDCAFTLLLCKRFSEPRYRDTFPDYWQSELRDSTDPVAEVRAFWQRIDANPDQSSNNF